MTDGGGKCHRHAGMLLALAMLFPGVASALPEVLDTADVTRLAEDCWQVDVALTVNFMTVSSFPSAPARYFYVMGQAAGGAGDTGFLGGREQRRLPLGQGAGILRVMYVGDLPGLKVLVFESDAPLYYRLGAHRGGTRLRVLISGDGDMTRCHSNKQVE